MTPEIDLADRHCACNHQPPPVAPARPLIVTCEQIDRAVAQFRDLTGDIEKARHAF